MVQPLNRNSGAAAANGKAGGGGNRLTSTYLETATDPVSDQILLAASTPLHRLRTLSADSVGIQRGYVLTADQV